MSIQYPVSHFFKRHLKSQVFSYLLKVLKKPKITSKDNYSLILPFFASV